MTKIDLYYDYRSPFAYFATQRLTLLSKLGAEIVWKPVLISGLLNLQDGREITADVQDPLCPAKRAHFMADIFRLIEYWNIAFAPPMPTPPVCDAAMAISALLVSKGVEHSAFRNRIFEAVWQNQSNVEDREVLCQCAAESGLDLDVNDQLIRDGSAILLERTKLAFSQGVFGVPTFVKGDELYFGADRMELLASTLR